MLIAAEEKINVQQICPLLQKQLCTLHFPTVEYTIYFSYCEIDSDTLRMIFIKKMHKNT